MFKVVMGGMLALGSLVAQAEVLEWTVNSEYDKTAQMKFFSKTYNREWPGGGKAYTLYEWREYVYRLECTPGEKICMGASSTPAETFTWGVGLRNDKGCANCCYTCGVAPVKSNLNP